MVRIHCRNGKLYISARRSIFEFSYAVENNTPKLELLRELVVPFKSVSTTTHSEEDQILASAPNVNGTLFAVATTSKQCFLYNILNDWTELRPALRLSKAPTAVIFDVHNKFVILSDRAGNVHRYSLDQKSSVKKENNSIDGEVSDGDEGELLLGHVSMVLDINMSDDGRFLITVDRDEKIRISRYPECYVIHRFCLGHSGDGSLRIWNIESGKQVAQCDCFEKKAIRCCRLFPNSCSKVTKVAVIFEHCKTVQIVTFIHENDDFEVKSAVVFGRTDGDYFEPIRDISESVVNCLHSVKETLLPLEKKIGFNNVEDYKQRKIERIKTKRRKLSLDSV
uniref:WD repeat-containing protein 4 homolog n=1 Tax=Setaria digitata TaxID=48799 RepID=A0A915Q4M6_9BILA